MNRGSFHNSFELRRFPDDVIGLGGMARVVKGVIRGAQGFERVIAVKELLPPYEDVPSYRKHLISEAQLLSDIRHPNVVQVLGMTEENGVVRIILEYIEGLSLRDFLEEGAELGLKISLEEIEVVISDVLQGLVGINNQLQTKGLRSRSFIHRDLCPENILIDFDGNSKIVDFGIAKTCSDSLPALRPSGLKGRYAYMSPEQKACEEMDCSSDLYAIGVVHRELLERIGDDSDTRLMKLLELLRTKIIIPRSLRIQSFTEYLSLAETVVLSGFGARNQLQSRIRELFPIISARRQSIRRTPLLPPQIEQVSDGHRQNLTRKTIGIIFALVITVLGNFSSDSQLRRRPETGIISYPPSIVRNSMTRSGRVPIQTLLRSEIIALRGGHVQLWIKSKAPPTAEQHQNSITSSGR